MSAASLHLWHLSAWTSEPEVMKSRLCLQTCHAHAGGHYTTLAGTHLAVVLGSDSDSSSQPGGSRKLAQVLTVG